VVLSRMKRKGFKIHGKKKARTAFRIRIFGKKVDLFYGPWR